MQPECVSGGRSRVTKASANNACTRRHDPQRSLASKPSREMWVALPGDTMKAMKNLLAKLVKDEQGGEVLEYALIAGLIVVAAIAIISAVGNKVLGRWTSLNASL